LEGPCPDLPGPETFWRWITAHEIGHEYWSEHVLGEGRDPLTWLMIGLGVHADGEYRRARGITDAGRQPPKYVCGVAQGFDTTMDVTQEQRAAIKWDFNNVVEHGKSAAVIDALATVIGNDAFEAGTARGLVCTVRVERVGAMRMPVMVAGAGESALAVYRQAADLTFDDPNCASPPSSCASRSPAADRSTGPRSRWLRPGRSCV
jgi:hypothetical protein